MIVRERIEEIAQTIYLRFYYPKLGLLRPPSRDFKNSPLVEEQQCYDIACLVWEEIIGSLDLYSGFVPPDRANTREDTDASKGQD